MSYSFYECRSLLSINLESFNTNNILNMEYILYSYNKLNYLNLSKLDITKVSNMENIFTFCSM